MILAQPLFCYQECGQVPPCELALSPSPNIAFQSCAKINTQFETRNQFLLPESTERPFRTGTDTHHPYLFVNKLVATCSVLR